MIRGAAKNHDDVAVVVDVADYALVRSEMEAQDGATTLQLRRGLAQKAYARTAAYDAAIANHLAAPRWRRRRPSGRSAAPCRSRCATARTRTSAPPSTARSTRGPASARRG